MKPKVPVFGCAALALLFAGYVTVLQVAGGLVGGSADLSLGRRVIIWMVEVVPLTILGGGALGWGLWLHRRDRAVDRARAWMLGRPRFTVAQLAEQQGWTLDRAAAVIAAWLQADPHPDLVFHRARGEWLHRDQIDRPDSRVVRSCDQCGAPHALFVMADERVSCDHCGASL